MAIKPITVSQLNRYISRILSTDPILGNVSVRGEISNLKYHGTGNIFFSLKDAGSRISCFIPSSAAKNLRYELTGGLEIVVSGYLSVYEPGGYYSLHVRDIDVSGAGSLALAFRALFEKLQREGLFDERYKKEIPVFPKRVCIITSATGAAVRDIIKIIRKRCRMTDILVYPCLVQGKSAAADIAESLRAVNEKFPETDVIIVGRGGGSAEELWAFNEEAVARSIFDSKIPVISAVGHETDFSISDYVADVRAETPTAAAVMAVPDTEEMIQQADERIGRMKSRLQMRIRMYESRLEAVRPDVFFRTLRERIRSFGQEVSLYRREMEFHMRQRLRFLTNEVEQCRTLLETGSPERIIARGYAVVRCADSPQTITSAGAVCAGQKLDILLKDGRLLCEVRDIRDGRVGTECGGGFSERRE